MTTLEELGRPVGNAYRYYRNHPAFFHGVNMAIIYLGIHGLSTLAHNSGYHDLEKILDVGNIAATGAYAFYSVNRILPESLRGDALKAAIVGLTAYAGLEEVRKIVHNYDATTLGQKVLEVVPFVWRNDSIGDSIKSLPASLIYVIFRFLRGVGQGARGPQSHP